MKKLLTVLLTIAMLFSLCACTGEHSSDRGTYDAATGVTTYRIGVAIYAYGDYTILYRDALESYFRTLETDTVKYELTTVNGKNDMAEQINQIQSFVSQGMDAVILNLVQSSSADVAIDTLVSADIPVILINREPLGEDGDESYAGILDNAEVCYVGADARQSGTYQGEMVIELADHGDINGDGKISYIMLEGDVDHQDTRYRTEYSVKALTDAGYEVECLDDQVGNWEQTKGQEICANALTQYGDLVEVVFCNNDTMALGAYAAITAAGRTVGKDIYLLGVDGLVEACKLVQNGGMTGTVFNDYISQSHKAADVTAQVLRGEAIENYYWLPYVKVTAGNAQEVADLQS